MNTKRENKNRRAADTRTAVVRQLKATRKEMHLTQEVLAQRAGTKKSNISRLESGTYNPSLDFLLKVADCMGKTLDIKVTDQSMEEQVHGKKETNHIGQ